LLIDRIDSSLGAKKEAQRLWIQYIHSKRFIHEEIEAEITKIKNSY